MLRCRDRQVCVGYDNVVVDAVSKRQKERCAMWISHFGVCSKQMSQGKVYSVVQ